MSSFAQEKRICAVCGNEQIYAVVASTNAIGHMDLDTRPPQMRRGTLPFEVQRCQKCNYANGNIEVLIGGLNKDVLKSQAYQAVVNDTKIEKTAKSFLLTAHLYSTVKLYEEAGLYFLNAAWIFDDLSEKDYAVRARKKSIENLTAYINSSESIDIAVLTVDLYRRTGDFQSAENMAIQILDYGVVPFLEKLLKYQLTLIESKDTLCHNTGEIS